MEQLLREISAQVSAIDERTKTFDGRLQKVESTCDDLRVSMATEKGRDEARDRDLAELRSVANAGGRSSGMTWGAAAGGMITILAAAAKAAWESITGTPSAAP